MITISRTDKDSSYSIDFLRHARSGETYISKTIALWSAEEDNQDCVGHAVTEMAGPLSGQDVEMLRAEPLNWDADPVFDLIAVNAEIACGEWIYSEELLSSN